MSPWPMMNEWGIPTFYLEALAYDFCERLKKKGMRIPDIAIAGGFSDEPNVFKAIAMGSPYVKAICMGRGLMIPAMVGKHIGIWVKNGDLPKTVSKYGTKIEEIFVSYEELKQKYGERLNEIPTGAIGVYTYTQKFRTGLQQTYGGKQEFCSAISFTQGRYGTY